jgi:hypothetical protein
MTDTIIEAGAFTAYVSPEDVDLEDESWFVNSQGYVVNNGSGPYAFKRLHRIVMARMVGRELGRWELVDHIDTNPLNNRRDNLRLCNSSENGFNRDLPAHNTTGYKGVSRNSAGARRPYQASITVNRKKQYLGSYATAEEAAKAYEQAARALVGDFHRGAR